MKPAYVFVGNRPFGIWDHDTVRRRQEFLRGLDPGQFEYLASVHRRRLGSKDSQRAALALRVSYGMALEALFAFIGAAVQAPHCPHAWLNLYMVRDVQAVIDLLDGTATIPHVLRQANWFGLSSAIHSSLVMEDKERETRTKKGFAEFWRLSAREFVESAQRDEYNAAKHALRLHPGGFRVQVDRHDLGGSEFGASLITAERISGADYRIATQSLNWDIGAMVGRLQLLAMSLNNVVSFLKIHCGEDATKVPFSWPRRLKVFEDVWRPMAGVKTLPVGVDVTADEIIPTTREAVERAYQTAR